MTRVCLRCGLWDDREEVTEIIWCDACAGPTHLLLHTCRNCGVQWTQRGNVKAGDCLECDKCKRCARPGQAVKNCKTCKKKYKRWTADRHGVEVRPVAPETA